MLHHVENHIEKMRRKPLHVKKQYSFLVSLTITLIIFGFWLNSFGIRANESTLANKAPSPISSLTAGAGDAFVYVKELFFGANKTVYSSDNVEVTGGGK